MTTQRTISLSRKELTTISNLLNSESSTRKNHLVSATLSHDTDYNAKAFSYAKEIEYLQELKSNFNHLINRLSSEGKGLVSLEIK